MAVQRIPRRRGRGHGWKAERLQPKPVVAHRAICATDDADTARSCAAKTGMRRVCCSSALMYTWMMTVKSAHTRQQREHHRVWYVMT